MGWLLAGRAERTLRLVVTTSHASLQRKASEPLSQTTLSSPNLSRQASYVAQQASRQPSQSSFAQRYDQIAGQIEQSLGHVPPSPAGPHINRDLSGSGAVTPPPRPRSADTYQEAQTAFKDFDGVHFSPIGEHAHELDSDGNALHRVSTRQSSGLLSLHSADILRTPQARPITYDEPPPAAGMVYYPAPVPRMLNLPKRLSQLPSASVQAKRRTQILSQIPDETLQSAPWIPPMAFSDSSVNGDEQHRRSGSGSQQRSIPDHPRGMLNERMSIANFNNLPPQLRATVFFEQQSIGQDVEVKESATATLESILAASATAPVTAFTDHPFAGDVRKSTFAPERVAKRRSTATLATMAPQELSKRRSSIGNFLRRTSSGNELGEQLKKSGSRGSMLMDFNDGGRKLQKRKSQMSLGGEMDRATGDDVDEQQTRPGYAGVDQHGDDEAYDDDDRGVGGSRPTSSHASDEDDEGLDGEGDEEDAEEETGDAVFAQPSTLLAELQVRKAKQKSRNRNAVTAYPNGMHSTLLQLDAVEEINKRQLQRRRINLAWEDPGNNGKEVGGEDEDVPLGVLFPSKDGLVNKKLGDGRDWTRPLGLMERRQIEDDEPLSSRRNRLHGLPPNYGADKRGIAGALASMSELHLAGQPDIPGEVDDEDGEHAGETLAQRLKRLKTKNVLDNAISDTVPKEGSGTVGTFMDDVMGQFGVGSNGGVDETPKASKQAAAPTAAGAEEEETLGQRRARLQRERQASGEQAAPRPALKTTNSMSNLPAKNPVGTRPTSQLYEPQQGTLLHSNAISQAKQKQQLYNTNIRSSSYIGLDRPLVDAQPATGYTPTNGLLAQQNMGALQGIPGFAGGIYNNGIGATFAQPSAAIPMLGPNGYFAPPMAGYGQQYANGMMQQPVYGAQYSFPAAPMTGFGGYGSQQQVGYRGTQLGMPMTGMVVEQPLDPGQRAKIEDWRMSVGL